MTSRLLPHGEPAAYFTFPSLTAVGLPHVTTTRHCPGIVSFAEPIAPEAPRAPFRPEAAAVLGSAGLELGRVSYARQVHGADAAQAPARGGFAGSVDLLVTGERRVPLAIFTADCLAIVLYDPTAQVLGLAHVGWRGTVRGATQAAVRVVGELGARAGALRVAIAPSIGPCCYEVDEPVTTEFASAFGERWTAWARPSRPGQRDAADRGRGGAGVGRQPATLHRMPSGAAVLVPQGESRPPGHGRRAPLTPPR